MQTPSFSSSRILLPVRRWFVAPTLLGALLLNFLPNVPWLWMPDWVALVVIFWGIREPRLVGMGWGFLLGLAMDVADASVLGQHALAYVLVAYGGRHSRAASCGSPCCNRLYTSCRSCFSHNSCNCASAPCPVSPSRAGATSPAPSLAPRCGCR